MVVVIPALLLVALLVALAFGSGAGPVGVLVVAWIGWRLVRRPA